MSALTLGDKTYTSLADFEQQVIRIPRNTKDLMLFIQFIDEPAPSPAPRFGLDVSFWQEWNQTTWARVILEANPHFVFIRCTYGVDKDYWFERHWTNSAGVLERNVYHYLLPHQSAQAQAQAVQRAIEGKDVTYIAIDVEESKLTGEMLDAFIAAMGHDPRLRVCYSRKSILDPLELSEAVTALDLWVASYETATPTLPRAWRTWAYWQPGVTLLPGGIKADVNVAGGDPTALQWWMVSRYGDKATKTTMGKCGPHGDGEMVFYDRPHGAPSAPRAVKASDVWDQYGCTFDGWVCVYRKPPAPELWCEASALRRVDA